jgi:hypothetical protein
LIIFLSCDENIEDSPAPGILRVTLESDPADTTIIIVTDTLTVSDGDVFLISVFQGRSYQDSTWGILYPSIESSRQEEMFYNLIDRENNIYNRFKIFESHLPPRAYDRIQFGIDSRFLKLRNFDEITVITPNNYYLNLPVNFEIRENTITELNVMVAPFIYIERYRDIYLFQPEMEIVGINYY